MNETFEIKSCEVCGEDNLPSMLNLGTHPLCDDLMPIDESRTCREYPIEILFCENCATAHQRYQVPKRDLFPSTYHYRSRFTADVLNGMSALVDACCARVGDLTGKKVIDIGCNDGSLLNFFKAKNASTIGIEPTGAYIDAEKEGHTVYNAFLSQEIAEKILKIHGKPDIITFTNVFAHIENLPEVIAALRLLSSPQLLIVIENHYLGAVFDRSQFDTFYHEHPRTYSYTSFLHIAKSLGMSLGSVEFPARYGGNIRVFIGGKEDPQHAELQAKIIAAEKAYPQRFAELNANIQKWIAAKGEFFKTLRAQNKKLRGKAFPGRAAILIKMLGIDESVISSVYEKPGSMKIGHYIPGTRIPICSDEELFLDINKEDEIVNFAWHISGEIKDYLNAHGFQGKVINVLDIEDFDA